MATAHLRITHSPFCLFVSFPTFFCSSHSVFFPPHMFKPTCTSCSHVLSVCSLEVHQLPGGHSYPRQNKLRSQQGEPSQQRTTQSAKCICVCIFCLFWPLNSGMSPERLSNGSCPTQRKSDSQCTILQDKRCPPPLLHTHALWIQVWKQSDECSFEASLISPAENYRIIRISLVSAGSVVTHLGLLLAHQCSSDTWRHLFTRVVNVFFCCYLHRKCGYIDITVVRLFKSWNWHTAFYFVSHVVLHIVLCYVDQKQLYYWLGVWKF